MAVSRHAPERPSHPPDDLEGAAREATVEGEALGPLHPGAIESPRPRRWGGFGPAFWLAVAWLVVVGVCAIFAGVLPVQNPNIPDIGARLSGPSAEHWLGADGLGRDTLARLVHGARVSVVIALSAVTIGLVVGGTLGMAVGFFRGRIESVVMAVIDVILAFPALVALLALVAYVGQSLTAIAVVIGILSIPTYARVARANTLSVAQREFVLAARAMGARNGRLLFKEILPNVVLPVATFALVAMGVIIVIEGALAFLGLSVAAPQATWGGMISEGKRHLQDAPWVAAIPSLVMFFTVLSLNFVGDNLRSRFDVKEANL